MEGFNAADKQVVAALLRMRSPEMQPLLAFFENLLVSTDGALRRATGDTFARLQGRALLIEEFLSAVDESPQTLEKMR
jgi:hypothetical protein